MLHTKFRGNRSLRRKFLKVFTIYQRGSHNRSCDLDHLYKLWFPVPRRLHIKFGFDWPSGLGGKDVSKWLTTTTTTPDTGAWVYYKRREWRKERG